MLYYIDKSCAQLLNAGDEEAVEFLEQLILHRKKCKNFVIADRGVLRELGKSEKLSSVVRAYCRILENRSSEFRMILAKSRKYYKVVSECKGDRVTEQNGQVIIQLSVKEGNQADFTDRCILLAESTDDIEFYKQIGRYYLEKSSISRMNLSVEEMIGGGDTTGTRLEHLIEEGQRQCLCILDSDKTYFGADCGSTLQKARDVMTAKGTENVELYPLFVHEIENLIPVGLLDKICANMPDTRPGIAFLKFLLEKDASQSSPVFYFDYKKGIPKDRYILKDSSKKDSVKKFRRLEGYRNYWKKYIEAYGVKMEETVSEPVIPGVCEKVLKHAVRYLKERCCQETGIEDSYIHTVWMELGAVIAAWGCTGNRIAA